MQYDLYVCKWVLQHNEYFYFKVVLLVLFLEHDQSTSFTTVLGGRAVALSRGLDEAALLYWHKSFYN